MKRIYLTKDKYAIVDDEDYERVMAIGKWRCHSENYAVIIVGIKNDKGRWTTKTIRMHRILANATKEDFVDHINGDRLDNRKINLRLCNKSQNNMNRPAQSNNKSGFKGVSWDKKNSKWYAQITSNRKYVCIGRFNTVVEAAIAYNKAAIELHGEFANLNKIPQ